MEDTSSLKAEGHALLQLLLCGLSPGGLTVDKSGKTDMTYKHFLRCSKNLLVHVLNSSNYGDVTLLLTILRYILVKTSSENSDEKKLLFSEYD